MKKIVDFKKVDSKKELQYIEVWSTFYANGFE